MKKIITSAVLFVMLSAGFTACDNVSVTTGDGSQKVEGNGKLSTKTHNVAAFSAIDLSGVFNVFLSQGAKEEVRIETDENIQPLILVNVVNDTLKLKMKEDISIEKMKKINVYITLVNISALHTAGVGELKCTSALRLNSLELDCEGVGATDLNIAAGRLTVKSQIVGALILSGTAKEATITHDGIGLISAFELHTEKMTLKASGMGAAEVYASNEINIRASGIGNVKYKGGAMKKDIQSERLGKVESVD